MRLSPDAQAIVMLCSRLSLDESDQLRPLTTGEWNTLARQLDSVNLRPEDLIARSPDEIQELNIGLDSDQILRIVSLLQRGAALAFEIERLETLGIWVMTRADAEYPSKYLEKLKAKSPPVLFCAGDKDLPGDPGLAMVGSRNVEERASSFAELIGNYCAREGLVVYSGGARGVDNFSMKAALEGMGYAVGILAHSLEDAIKKKDYRDALEAGNLTLMTPYSPNAGFSVGNAMGRNKLIYALADYALVIASDFEKGGTWAGATETLKNEWTPLFVLDADYVPEGNRELIKLGAIPLTDPPPFADKEIRTWLDENSSFSPKPPIQPKLL